MDITDRSLTSATESLCPDCLQRIPAQRVVQGEDVYLVKRCPEHGEYRTLVWHGSPLWDSWVRPTIPTPPRECYTPVVKGCPFDCGLCAEHYKTTCTALLEVTQRCNLNCRFCFANAGTELDEPSLGIIEGWYKKVLAASGPVNIQLSGGEPTLRNDLPEIVKLGRELGFHFIQINTNGLRLAEDCLFLSRLQKAGLSSVFLQFDGTEDQVYRAIRGRNLLDIKVKAIENCAEYGIGVVLVPTLIPGINTDNIGGIVKFALDNHPAVRGVHFQPVSYFGRIPQEPLDRDRITLPEVIQAIEEQTGGLIKAANLKPHNGRCSFSGSFTRRADGSIKPIVNNSCCEGLERADELAKKTRTFVARQWSGADSFKVRNSTTDTGDSWDNLIQQLKTYAFSLSGMAFQDVWNLDLERLKNCCIHVVSPEGKLIPFCAYNLTAKNGHSIYRRGR
ncbi:putative Fe-S oxidoreductase [Desulfosporosinus acidiphilus SJ4]|uniref:Putative Fe-S oxidoreductase n=1 Tax=Desulfosporosinus acidiphilus (strain DSM 22704 / JCM 16185 / SJ4) TaxID=646529 RepID=I4D760_DESAJ|nr:radical SAM (seleno)protein TrsS [Desulfosporosinus acidiphilus]AFM41634.1 putative Fe-S oxidoreductase [Desulfosporosinus acidiphilus SJ4]